LGLQEGKPIIKVEFRPSESVSQSLITKSPR